MGKIITTLIDHFGSMTPKLRDNSYNFAFSKHYNIFRNNRLTPNPTWTTITDGGEKITRFTYAKAPSSAYAVWGLGDDGTGDPQIFKLSLGDTAWTSVGAFTPNAARNSDTFIEYKDYLFGFQAGYMWQCGLLTSGAPTLDGDFATFASWVNVGQPIHHKADDYLYIFVDNKVYKMTDGTTIVGGGATPTAQLTLSSNMKIVGGASYGNYLAIVCSPKNLGATNSVMYLWDRDSSLTTLTSKIDLGMGEIKHVSESEDGGIWITQQARRTVGITSKNNYFSIKYFNGSLQSFDFPVGMSSDYFSSVSLVGNSCEERGVFYFPAVCTAYDSLGALETSHIIFSARRNGGVIELVGDQEVTGVTQNINGIFSVGGIWFVSYDTAAKTLFSSLSTTASSCTYESKIFNNDDASLTKKLISFTITFVPSYDTSTDDIVVSYRTDNQRAWTELLSASNNSPTTMRITRTVNSAGTTLPRYKEIQFKIVSTGTMEITSFKFKSEFIDNDVT